MGTLPAIFFCHPAVYAVGKNYVITVPVNAMCYMWATVGGKKYYDSSNGKLRRNRLVHKIKVPTEVLDAAKEYTIGFRPYSVDPLSVTPEEYTSAFRPVDPEKGKINAYQIADSHGFVEEAIAAGRYFESVGEELDFVILNGDIFSSSQRVEYYSLIHKIAGEISRGEIPVVHARGNHDTRGKAADLFADYMPSEKGKTYYTFRIGPIWGISLDCGEDKLDEHHEYSNANVFARFREEETKWLESVVNADNPEYRDEGIKYRIIISHSNFARRWYPPFNIEEERYAYWCKLLRKIRPHFMFCGHEHKCYVSMIDGPLDAFGQPCPIVVASEPSEYDREKHFTGCAISLKGYLANFLYTDEKHFIRGEDNFLDIEDHIRKFDMKGEPR